jgi:hypothetical protein
MHAMTNRRSPLNLIKVFHVACNSAATSTKAVAITVTPQSEKADLIRHISAPVYTKADHAALSCAKTWTNKFLLLPDLRRSGPRHAYA